MLHLRANAYVLLNNNGAAVPVVLRCCGAMVLRCAHARQCWDLCCGFTINFVADRVSVFEIKSPTGTCIEKIKILRK